MAKHVALEPVPLAERQLELDREKTKRFPDLFAHKMQRMSASPLAFLRGAAPLFYEILAMRPDLADGPEGEGWILGDLHLENFGAYRPDPLGADDGSHGRSKGHQALFDLNDFDDASVGPWRFDLLRLTTSLLLGGRELGANGVVALGLVDRLLDAWEKHAFHRARLPAPPAPVLALIDQASDRSRAELLAGRTRVVSGKRRFVRGPRYANLPKAITDRVPDAFHRYLAGLPDEDRPHKGSCEILDCALRIAGTGSLGGLRIAILVKGKGSADGAWIFDMKEQGTPSTSRLLPKSKLDPAVRVETAFEKCLERPPRLIGTTKLEHHPMFVRKLSPQEDKLNLRRLEGADLPMLASYLGALIGRAHRSGATKPPRSPWKPADLMAVRERAIYLAGVHEATYLALCQRMRHVLPKEP